MMEPRMMRMCDGCEQMFDESEQDSVQPQPTKASASVSMESGPEMARQRKSRGIVRPVSISSGVPCSFEEHREPNKAFFMMKHDQPNTGDGKREGSCTRRQGLMVPSFPDAVVREATNCFPVWAWHCVNCGDWVDETIIKN